MTNLPALVQVYRDGWRKAIHVGTGRKFERVIIMASKSLRVKKLIKSEATSIRPVENYSLFQAAEHFLDVADKYGASNEVWHCLNDIISKGEV